MGDTLIFGQMKGIMEIHNLFNFYRYSICGCHVVVKLNIFKVYRTQQKGEFGLLLVFHGLQPQIKFDLYQNFTNGAMQGKASNMLRFFKYS